MKLIKSKSWKKTIIKSDSTIKDAINNLNKVQLKIVNVVDNKNKFIGTITDGDIRRGLLNDYNKDFKIISGPIPEGSPIVKAKGWGIFFIKF